MDYSRFSYDDFVREEAYNASSLKCFAFRHGYDVKDGYVLSLGNMVKGFGFDLQGVHFNNSESAYIAGTFSNGTDKHIAIQRELVENNNGFMAKKKIRKPHEAEKRSDWEEFNVQWMLYCVWMKCLGNGGFRKVLLALPSDGVIIEDSTFQNSRTATVWGTKNDELKKRLRMLTKELKAQGKRKATIKREQDRMRLGEWSTVGVFRGKNVMGKILMACRDALHNGTEPLIDYTLLTEKQINLLGRLISFEVTQAA